MLPQSQTLVIPQDLIASYGASLGIAPNLLAQAFGIKPAFQALRPLPEQEAILPTLLHPGSLSFTTALLEEDLFLSSTVLSGNGTFALCHREESNLDILSLSQKEICDFFLSGLSISSSGNSPESLPPITFSLSENGLKTFFSVLDALKEHSFKQQLNIALPFSGFTAEGLASQTIEHRKIGDLRWLTLFLEALEWEDSSMDFKTGLEELTSQGFLAPDSQRYLPHPDAAVLFDEITAPKALLGIQSVFYHEGNPQHLYGLFLRTKHFLWYVERGETSFLSVVTAEKSEELLSILLGPGENPPMLSLEDAAAYAHSQNTMKNPLPELVIPASEGASITIQDSPPVDLERNTWLCTCGEIASGNFCPKCGAKRSQAPPPTPSAPPKFCSKCGTPLNPNARFCGKCGNKLM